MVIRATAVFLMMVHLHLNRLDMRFERGASVFKLVSYVLDRVAFVFELSTSPL